MIYLSPSTQTDNRYNNGIDNECDVCYSIAEMVYNTLKARGVSVTLGAKHASLIERCNESDRVKADYHVCIHTNAGGGEGTRVYYYPSNRNDAVINRLLKEVGAVSCGTYDVMVGNSTFLEIKRPKAITCYLELEFHDKYGQFIVDHKKDFADAIVRGILGEDKKVIDNKISGSDHKYAVQIGEFRNREEAIKCAYELKEKYSLSSIIKEV